MTLLEMQTKQTAKRQSKDVERILRDEPSTIHPIARARGVTHDDICAGMPCTIRLTNFTEGPATILSVEHSKNGRAWRIRVRPEFHAYLSDWELSNRGWAFTLSDVPAVKSTLRHVVVKIPFFAYRHGSPGMDKTMWQHRRLLVGHAEPRDPTLTDMIAATREGFIPHRFRLFTSAEVEQKTEEIERFYASTSLGLNRWLTSRGIGAATPDTLDSLLGQADRPATDLQCP